MKKRGKTLMEIFSEEPKYPGDTVVHLENKKEKSAPTLESVSRKIDELKKRISDLEIENLRLMSDNRALRAKAYVSRLESF